jgi:hypothetical protein
MKRLLVLALVLSACAVTIDTSSIEVSPPIIPSEIALDKPVNAGLEIAGDSTNTEIVFVALQYKDGSRWINLEEPSEILLNSTEQIPLELEPGNYTLRTALWGLQPELGSEAEKVSSEVNIQVIDNSTQLEQIATAFNQRLIADVNASKALQRCQTSTDIPECMIQFSTLFQDFIWAANDVKDIGAITRLTSNLQPQLSSVMYFHNIVLTKLESAYTNHCLDGINSSSAVATCLRKLQSNDISTTRKSLKQSLKVFNRLLETASYETFAYSSTKGLFG